MAQRWITRQYNIQDGLPNSNVFYVYQDQEGLIWLGTDNGLASFDGFQVETIGTEDGLLGPHITGITENLQDELLVGSYRRGINILRQGVVIPPDSSSQMCPFGYDLIQLGEKTAFSSASTLYIKSSTGIQQIGLRPTLNTHFGKNYNQSFSFHVNIAPYSEKESLLVGCLGGLFLYKDQELKTFCDSLFWNLPVYSMYETQQGDLWVGSFGKLLHIRDCEVMATYTEGIPADKWVHRILQDQKGNLWISVNGYGLCELNRSQSRVDFLGERLNIGHTDVNYLMEDKEGNIWIATNGQGVLMIAYSDFQFFDSEQGLKGSQITALAQSPDGKLYVGTHKGLFLKRGNHFDRIQLFDSPGDAYVFDLEYVEGLGMVVAARMSTSLSSSYVRRISDEILLIQSYTCLSMGNNSLLYQGIDYDQPITIAKIEADRSLIESRNISFPSLEKQQAYRIQKLFADDKGRVWIATRSHGLWMLPNLEANVTGEETEDIVPPSIRQRSIRDFLSVSDSLYWIATENGLGKWESESWKFFGEADGLGANYCSSLVLDEDGGVWIGTARGLSYYQAGEFMTLGPEEGLASPEIHALHLDRAGNGIWIGTGNGLYFLPFHSSFSSRSQVSHTIITHLSSRDSVYRYPEDLVLAGEESDLEIRFRSLFYRHPDQVVYQYRLANRQQQWKTTRTPRIEYASLADGLYDFEVRASLNRGKWSEPDKLHFRIKSPFWKTFWFYLILALALVVMVILLARWRIRGIRQTEREKRDLRNQIYELEQKALGAMMNPHFIFNSLNSIQHYLNLYDKEAANEYLAKFARLVRMNMEVAQQSLTPLDEELYRLQLYLSLEQMRFGDQFEYDIQIDPELDPEEIELPSMIIQPFVENAIWHGILPAKRSGKILIHVSNSSEQMVRICIDDNGVGIKQDSMSADNRTKSSHISRGMEITKERLRLFSPQSQLTVRPLLTEEGRSAGTQVEIYIPLEETNIR